VQAKPPAWTYERRDPRPRPQKPEALDGVDEAEKESENKDTDEDQGELRLRVHKVRCRTTHRRLVSIMLMFQSSAWTEPLLGVMIMSLYVPLGQCRFLLFSAHRSPS
jgi:hypothetical protein